VLDGGAGADVLDGGAGADTMIGGLGNDTYVVDNVGDVVSESLNQGIDLVQASVSFALGANVENLTLTGASAINGSGNELDNAITGNSAVNELYGFGGNDTLDGGAGADRMYGGLGNDTYVVDNAADQTFEASPAWGADLVLASVTYWLGTNIDNLTLTGAAAINGNGNDLDNVITGNSASNVLFGYGGNDTLDGGGGGDQMYGGLGNDTYYVDNVNDVAFESSSAWGTDTVISTVTYFLSTNIENLTLAGAAAVNASGNALDNILIGNSAANQLFGNAGNDVLDGGAGGDQMYGGDGNDTYYVDNVNDVVFEANAAWGVDTIYSSVTLTLPTNIDNLILTGSAAIDGSGNATDNSVTGNSASNTLFGYAGNDILDGGAGNDFLFGGDGNDTYYVDSSSDVTFEASAAWGTDLVYASASFTLGTNIDNLTLVGSANINGTGNGLDNVITGNSGANTLDGSAGADTIDGGAGTDTLNGGAGNDVFVFHAGEANGDTVLDFNGQGAGAGDSFDFEGYGGAGATFIQLDATHWQINSADNTIHDVITLANGATVDPTDYVFGP
jgi:Ca2+-binding RTX toxin-like protein